MYTPRTFLVHIDDDDDEWVTRQQQKTFWTNIYSTPILFMFSDFFLLFLTSNSNFL